MCEGQRMALEMIKRKKGAGGITPEMILIHEKICEDFAKMQKEINEIKQDVSDIKGDISNIQVSHKMTDEKVDKILEYLTDKDKPSLFEMTLNSPNGKYVFWTIIIIIIVIAAIFGVPLTGFSGLISMGG